LFVMTYVNVANEPAVIVLPSGVLVNWTLGAASANVAPSVQSTAKIAAADRRNTERRVAHPECISRS